LFYGFFEQTEVGTESLAGFAQGEINSYDIDEGDQQSQPEAIATDEIIGFEIPFPIPGDPQITKSGKLEPDIDIESFETDRSRLHQGVSVFGRVYRLVLSDTRVQAPPSDGIGAAQMEILMNGNLASNLPRLERS
jgi:hypothetical protein